MSPLTVFLLVAAGIILCIVLSGVFSASEMAYNSVSSNPVRLENEAEEGNKKAGRALKILERFEDALGAILIGNNLVNIAASSLGTVALITLFAVLGKGSEEADAWSWAPPVIITVLVIIFGETIPKICAKSNANRYAKNNSAFIRVLMILLFPIIWVVVKAVGWLTSRVKEENADEDEAAEELQNMIQMAGDEGVIDEDQLELATAAIDFNDISAYEIMMARVDMQAIDINDSLEDILAFVDETPYSRIPVYEDSIDHIIGTLHLNHLLKAMTESETPDIRSLLLKPCFVYKTTKLPQVLAKLKAARQHLAIVTDEYSGTLGVVSMEDVLEQIVGDIWDESDVIEEEVTVKRDGEMLLDGDLSIFEFAELIGLSEEEIECESETLGGFVIETLGTFPNAGDAFDYKGFRLSVSEVDGLRVEKVLCEKIGENEEE